MLRNESEAIQPIEIDIAFAPAGIAIDSDGCGVRSRGRGFNLGVSGLGGHSQKKCCPDKADVQAYAGIQTHWEAQFNTLFQKSRLQSNCNVHELSQNRTNEMLRK